MLKFLKYFVIVLVILSAIMLFFLIATWKDKNIIYFKDLGNNINFSIAGQDPDTFTYKYTYTKNYKFDSTSISNIDIESDIFDIIIENSDDEKLEVSIDLLFGARNLDILKNFQNEVIKKVNKSFHTLKIILKIPEDVRNNIDFKGNTGVKGKIIIKIPYSSTFKKISITGVSSDIKILTDFINSDLLDFNTVSGDFEANNIKADRFNFNSVSGDVKINILECDSIKSNTISGDMKIESMLCEDSIFSSTSGDLIINNMEKLEKIKASTVSGDVKMIFPLEFKKRFNVYIDTVSGNILTKDFKIIKGKKVQFVNKNADGEIKINTVSGDINLIYK